MMAQNYRGGSKNMTRRPNRKIGEHERLHCRRLCNRCMKAEIPFESQVKECDNCLKLKS